MNSSKSSALKTQAVSATIWSAIDIFGRQTVSFGLSIILARLLTPADYGTVGLLTIFIAIASVFINSGFSSALIQRQDISEVDLSSVFYFNIVVAIILSCMLSLFAPLIASFYKMPILIPLTRLMAVSLFVGAFGSVQATLLSKQLNFRRQCLISFASMIISGSVAVYMALHKYGVWSLAVSSFTGIFINTILLWIFSPWRPRLILSIAAIRSLFRYSSFLLISGLLDTVFTKLNTLIIGKFYSVNDLGFYSRADGTQQLPANLLSGVISRVAFPIFAAAQQNKELLQAGLKKAIVMTMMLNIPIMIGISVSARPLVLVLFGNQWLSCVPYLQILCLGGILWPLHVINLNILTAQGHSNLFFRLEVIKKVVGIVILGIACFFGIIAIAWSTVISGVLYFILNARYSGQILNYGVLKQSVDLVPYLVASLIMAFFAWSVTFLSIKSPFILLFVQMFLSIAVYLLVCYALRLTVFLESMQLVISRLRPAPPIGMK